MSASSTPAVRAAQRAGVAFEVLEYDYDPEADGIGLHAAQALGMPPSMVFKTLVVAVDTRKLVCAILPSDARLSLKALAAAAGGRKAELADPKKAEGATGYVVGGISPLGQRKRLPTFIDSSAERLERIVVNAGRRGLQLRLDPKDLIAATAAVVAPLQA